MIKHNIQFITDNYVFTIELDNASNILLQEETVCHEHSIIEAIIQFILFVHTHKIQYLTIYDSKKRDYYRFNHWSESVVAYMNCIQYKYEPQTDYYVFLTEIGYAEDSLYIDKLKKIVNKSKNQ